MQKKFFYAFLQRYLYFWFTRHRFMCVFHNRKGKVMKTSKRVLLGVVLLSGWVICSHAGFEEGDTERLLYGYNSVGHPQPVVSLPQPGYYSFPNETTHYFPGNSAHYASVSDRPDAPMPPYQILASFDSSYGGIDLSHYEHVICQDEQGDSPCTALQYYFANLPMLSIEHFTLRAPAQEDAQALQPLFGQGVNSLFNRLVHYRTAGGIVPWIICAKPDGRPVGYCGFDSFENGRPILVYELLKGHRNDENLKNILEIVLLQAFCHPAFNSKEVVMRCLTDRGREQLDSLGFGYEGERYQLCGGQYIQCYEYYLTQENFFAHRTEPSSVEVVEVPPTKLIVEKNDQGTFLRRYLERRSRKQTEEMYKAMTQGLE